VPKTSSITRVSNRIVASPLIWGGLACLGFYALLGQSTLNNPLVARYFESHPVEYITTALFFVGVAALVMKVLNLAIQRTGLEHPFLEAAPDDGQPVEDAAGLLSQLEGAPAPYRNGYLVRRLHAAVDFVRRKGTAETLDSHLHYLADEDVGRMHASYAFTRIIIWAIPILGFLGTVIGITLAIAQLSPQALEQSLPAVTSGLGVAFDTTALALSLSIVLMFAKFFVEQLETHLLVRIDQRVTEELVGRFQEYGGANDPNLAVIHRAADAVVGSSEQLIKLQAKIWQDTIDEANQRWTSLTSSAGEVVEKALAEAVASSLEQHTAVLDDRLEQHRARLAEAIAADVETIASATESHATTLAENSKEQVTILSECLREIGTELAESVDAHREAVSDGAAKHVDVLASSLAKHSEAIAESEQSLADENRRHMSEVQLAIVESAAAAVEQHEQLVKQGDVLLKVVDATGQIKRLEETLNHNLSALAGAHNFEETVTSLAAAIQLLSARLGYPTTDVASVQLELDDQQPPAAA
jgi:biopolymer transport protein ExbB/TolQ